MCRCLCLQNLTLHRRCFERGFSGAFWILNPHQDQACGVASFSFSSVVCHSTRTKMMSSMLCNVTYFEEFRVLKVKIQLMYLRQMSKLSLMCQRLCFSRLLLCFYLKLLMLIWIKESYCADHSVANGNMTQYSLAVFSLVYKFSRLINL